jgi:tetraacyldisaccharide 4'-kinase
MAAWDAYHRHAATPARPDIPVISVGNIAVGGSGKTPAVMHLAERLAALGRQVGVLTRGYAGGVSADEVLLLRQRCPKARLYVNPDRAQSARQAVADACDVLLLDDGFQHRRLARDLDVVLLPATEPFGFGHMLPRGFLREPLSALQRADCIVLTGCDHVADEQLTDIEKCLASYARPGVPILRAVHRPVELTDMALQSAKSLPTAEGTAVLASAIGNPDAFGRTVASLGLDVVAHQLWPDHHRFTTGDVQLLRELHERHRPDWLLTTEKDAVKWQALPLPADLPLLAVRVAFDFVDDGDTMLSRLMDSILSKRN